MSSTDGAAFNGIANVVALHKEFVYSNALRTGALDSSHLMFDLAHFTCPHNIVL